MTSKISAIIALLFLYLSSAFAVSPEQIGTYKGIAKFKRYDLDTGKRKSYKGEVTVEIRNGTGFGFGYLYGKSGGSHLSLIHI